MRKAKNTKGAKKNKKEESKIIARKYSRFQTMQLE